VGNREKVVRSVVISGTGVFTPPETITNAELVVAYNAYADKQNELFSDEIASGAREALTHSNEEFIFKASGIEQRYVMEKSGILDPDMMHPDLPQRSDDEPGIMAEIAIAAAKEALANAGKTAADVGAVICAASNHERAYPAIAIEVQNELGIEGFGFDMNVACSSATFGIQAAVDMIRAGSTDCILIVNPEITSGHLEWRDRDCHFIFGDVCTAVVLEAKDNATSGNQYEVLSTRCLTQFSNNIRNNHGFLRRDCQNYRKHKLIKQRREKKYKHQKNAIVVDGEAGIIGGTIKTKGAEVTQPDRAKNQHDKNHRQKCRVKTGIAQDQNGRGYAVTYDIYQQVKLATKGPIIAGSPLHSARNKPIGPIKRNRPDHADHRGRVEADDKEIDGKQGATQTGKRADIGQVFDIRQNWLGLWVVI